jgi:starch synthase
MQVYFIDNEDYFQRKYTLQDSHNVYFSDNDERAIFFARGVIETVKKLQWAPDLIHCQGWFTSLIPLYIKKYYHDDPLFIDSLVVTSIYDNEFDKSMDPRVIDKLRFDGINDKDIEVLKEPTYLNLMKLAVNFSDGIIQGSEKANADIIQYITKSAKPMLSYQAEDVYIDRYSDFFDQILSTVVNGAK